MSRIDLTKRFPPSKPCACDTCRSYCQRPGWWTVAEATRAIDAGYAERMMLEIAPKQAFGVLAPAFKGNEGRVALQLLAAEGCTFLRAQGCELFGTDVQPLECRYCHHTRRGLGPKCHRAIAKDWHRKEGQQLVIRWSIVTGLFEHEGLILTKPQA